MYEVVRTVAAYHVHPYQSASVLRAHGRLSQLLTFSSRVQQLTKMAPTRRTFIDMVLATNNVCRITSEKTRLSNLHPPQGQVRQASPMRQLCQERHTRRVRTC
jgi:hypothetical protein